MEKKQNKTSAGKHGFSDQIRHVWCEPVMTGGSSIISISTSKSKNTSVNKMGAFDHIWHISFWIIRKTKEADLKEYK